MNRHYHMKEYIETKFNAVLGKSETNWVIDLETWFKIHTNVFNFATVSPQNHIELFL